MRNCSAAKERTIMSEGAIPVGKTVARTIEAVLSGWIVKDAAVLYLAEKYDAAATNAILALSLVLTSEALMWLWQARARWKMSSDEFLARGVQVIILVFMAADAATWLSTGDGFGVNQPGCLFSLVILEGIIRRVIRPDARPRLMAQALQRAQARVRVFTHLPPGKVRETLGLVRGISDIEAGSGLEFELAEQQALYFMLKQALALGANAVMDARLTTATYETSGSRWQVSRPVYTGTAVRL
jgi:uncharacterized protein YbjQ (UPF0145 family)